MRKVDVGLHDTTVGIWQDDPNDPTFHSEIFAGIIRHMRSRGWTVGQDRQVAKHYRLIRKNFRLARQGAFKASLQISGRHIEIAFWAETWKADNPNGHRYDFDKRQRLSHMDRRRLTVEERAIIRWIGTTAAVAVSQPTPMPSSGLVTATEYVQAQYAESWHSDKALGRPICRHDSNRKSADGELIEHGQIVWSTDSKGRIIRGTALYSINNTWWIITGPHGILSTSCWKIFTRQPSDLRRKRNDRLRRGRLEAEIAWAIARDDFTRAATLRKVAFGSAPIYRIWSRDKGLYYGPQCCGYTPDISRAGRYTREEAEREVCRVPHILHAIGPDGEREDFGMVAEVA